MSVSLENVNTISSMAITIVLLLTLHSVVAFIDDDPGITIPENVDMNVGENVNISCIINPAIFPNGSCKMSFVLKETKERVPDEDIVIMNSTYIVYMLRNAAEQKSTFICKCNNYSIRESNVYVGTAPHGVTKFDCRSYDFEFMVCNFTYPENKVYTQYNLTYSNNLPNYQTPVSCIFDGRNLAVCNITADQSYRPHVEEYHFKVHSSNSLGNFKQEFTINNFNVMIPSSPGDAFRIHRLTTNSMEALWSMPKYDLYTSNKHRGLQWEVLIQPDKFPARNLSSQVRVTPLERDCKLVLNDLPYAHYWYELRLRVKVRTAASSDDMWSPTFKYRFRTRPRIPDRPPRADNGSFYINSLKTQLRLYWEQLEEWEENGDNISYVIEAMEAVERGGTRRAIEPLKQNGSFAIFNWSDNLHYFFNISSRNHIGKSLTSSQIIIYPQTTRLPDEYTPDSIHNVYHQTNRSYTLTWLPPKRSGVLDYTVYWCYSKVAMPTECRESIHFRRVSSDVRRFVTEPQKTEHDHSLTLAVSANYFEYNTGMHWTSCSVDVNSDFEPMTPELIQPISATTLRLQWSSKTVCPSILNGYNLTYCIVSPSSLDDSGLLESFTNGKTVSEDNAQCEGPITIDKNSNKCNITGLKPYTWYRFEMFMYSNIKVGRPGKPLLVRTSESAPSPPRQLRVLELTNTSVKLSWLPPEQANGYIRRYIVKMNNNEYTVNATTLQDVDKIIFIQENLTSYTRYKVFVIAETIEKSECSNDHIFVTPMSAPGPVVTSNWNNINDIEVELKWARPTIAGGRLDYYEIAVTQLHGDYEERRRISAVFGNSCRLRVPLCPDRNFQTKVEVRAINAALLNSTEVNLLDVEAQQISNKFDYDQFKYEGNDDLVCTGTNDNANANEQTSMAKLTHYQNKHLYVLYKSNWSQITSYGCGPNPLVKITVITVMVVTITILLMSFMFFATKKLKMMSDIKCTLPAGLNAYLTKDLNGGGGGTESAGGCVDNDNITLPNGEIIGGSVFLNDFLASSSPSRNAASLPPPDIGGSHERLHNEEHHLLGAHKNDSGYIGDGLIFGRSISAVATSVSADNDGGGEEDLMNYGRREYLNSESSADSLIGSTNSSGGVVAGEVDATAQQDIVVAPLNGMPLPLKRIAEEPSNYIQLPQVQAAVVGSMGGYVTAAKWTEWAQTPHLTSSPPSQIRQGSNEATVKDGYTDASAFAMPQKGCQKPTTSATALSGYITSSELTKMMQPKPMARDGKTASHSGYIKPTDWKVAEQNVWSQPINNKDFEGAFRSDYIKVSDFSANNAAWSQIQQQQQQQKQQPITIAPNKSGYITVDSLTAMTLPTPNLKADRKELGEGVETSHTFSPNPISIHHGSSCPPTPALTVTRTNSSAYVQPSTLQKLLLATPPPQTTTGIKSTNSPTNDTNFSGYTTLDALSKLTPNQSVDNVMNSTVTQRTAGGTGGKPGLIGYVTQREMNEFGQQQQQMH